MSDHTPHGDDIRVLQLQVDRYLKSLEYVPKVDRLALTRSRQQFTTAFDFLSLAANPAPEGDGAITS